MQLTDAQVSAMRGALRQFGYPDIADAEVRAEADAIIAGDQPDNIIGMFVQGWLREAGLVPVKA